MLAGHQEDTQHSRRLPAQVHHEWAPLRGVADRFTLTRQNLEHGPLAHIGLFPATIQQSNLAAVSHRDSSALFRAIFFIKVTAQSPSIRDDITGIGLRLENSCTKR